MRVIFDLGHPAHFHLFKHTIIGLRESGHDVEIIVRQKDCLIDLLEEAEWSYHLAARPKIGLLGLALQNLKAFRLAVSLAKKKPVDFMVGTSIVVGPAARLTGATSLVFNEDDAKAVPIFSKLAYPAAHYIITPNCVKFEDYGKKHLTYPGYHELAYLHPNRYAPNPNILTELGVGPNEKYFLVRLVSLTAHHDIGESGLSTEQARTIVQHLARHGRVFISAETVIAPELNDYILHVGVERIFDVLAFAEIVIGDSQTMIAEAAVLGTAALRCNTFVGRLAYLEELEYNYGLTVGIRPENFDMLLAQLDKWLSQPALKQQWQQKRRKMLSECIDLTDWTIKLFHRLAEGADVYI